MRRFERSWPRPRARFLAHALACAGTLCLGLAVAPIPACLGDDGVAAASDPDLAALEALYKTRIPPADAADALQRLDDLILDTRHGGGLDRVDALLAVATASDFVKNDPVRLNRAKVLKSILEVRRKAAQLEHARKEGAAGDTKTEEKDAKTEEKDKDAKDKTEAKEKDAKDKTEAKDKAPQDKDADLAALERSLYQHIAEAFLARDFRVVVPDYVKMSRFIKESALPLFNDSQRRNSLETAFDTLDKRLDLEKRRQPELQARLPLIPPVTLSVRNATRNRQVDLPVRVSGQSYNIPAGGKITFRFANQIEYPVYHQGPAQNRSDWKPYPVERAGELAFGYEKVLNRSRWNIRFSTEEEVGRREGPAKDDANKGKDKTEAKDDAKDKDKTEAKDPKGGAADAPKGAEAPRRDLGRRLLAATPVPVWLTALLLSSDDAPALTPEQRAAATYLGLPTDRGPAGLPPDKEEEWKSGVRIFLTNKAFPDVYGRYRNPGAPRSVGPQTDFDLTLNLLESCTSLAGTTLDAATKANTPTDKDEGLKTYEKLRGFWERNEELLQALRQGSEFKAKDEHARKTDEDTISDIYSYMQVHQSTARSLVDLIAGLRNLEDTPPSPSYPELDRFTRKLDRLEERYEETKQDLGVRVDEVQRARLQSYSPWKPGPGGRYYSCVFRWRPDGTEEVRESACLFFPHDPTHIYFVARQPYAYAINGQRVVGLSQVCWGRYNIAAAPTGQAAWQWVPNSDRFVVPFGTHPSDRRFDPPVELPVVYRSLNEQQRMLWPSLVGLPREASTYASYATSAPAEGVLFDIDAEAPPAPSDEAAPFLPDDQDAPPPAPSGG